MCFEGPPGKDAICPKCPLAEQLEMRAPTQCPTVEIMQECPKEFGGGGGGGLWNGGGEGEEMRMLSPRLVDKLLPLVVELVGELQRA
jgi:hypothetical protein